VEKCDFERVWIRYQCCVIFACFLSCVLVFNSPVATPAHGLLELSPIHGLRFIGERELACFVYLCHHPRSHFTTLLTRALFHGPFHCSYICSFHFRGQRVFLNWGPFRRVCDLWCHTKIALHALLIFTEQVVPIHKHITVLYSELPRYQEQKQTQWN